MSLSKSQKKRLYGENIEAKAVQKAPAATATPKKSVASRASSYDVAAQPESQSSFMFAGVALVVALLLMAYYYFWILPQLNEHAGTTVPELMFWLNSDHAFKVAQGLGAENLVQYQFIHRSSGLIFPLMFAGAWIALIAAARFSTVASRVMLLIPGLWAVVFIAGNFVLDAALANPASGPVGLAALLIAIRQILFVACWIQLGWMAVRLVQNKVTAFSRGELPGQQRVR